MTPATEPQGPFLEVRPALGPPDAILLSSPSKSATHRAILLGARTPHTIIEHPLISADTAASLRLAVALGARVSAEPATEAGGRMLARIGDGITDIQALHDGDGSPDVPTAWRGVVLDEVLLRMAPEVPRPLFAANVRLHVEGGARRGADGVVIDLANSGTTLRIGTAVASTMPQRLTLSGDASLVTRPMGPLVDALTALGATAACAGANGRPPVTVQGPWTTDTVSVPGNVSSQYISALLIAAQGGAGLTLNVTTPLKSAPYVDVTRALVARFGGQVDVVPATGRDDGPVYVVPPGTHLRPTRVFVPGDHSSAAFPLVAAAITGGRVALTGLDPESEQGDRAVLTTLAAAGCAIEWSDDPEHDGGRLVTCTAPAGPPQAFTHSFTDTPDLFPALAVLAARAAGTSHLVDAAHVRLKECDRVAAMARALDTLGVPVTETPDTLTITGTPGAPLPAAALETHDDHRILMALAVLGLVGPGPLYITDPGCYHVSYPRFRLDLDTLGGATRVVDHEDAMHAIARENAASSPPEARP